MEQSIRALVSMVHELMPVMRKNEILHKSDGSITESSKWILYEDYFGLTTQTNERVEFGVAMTDRDKRLAVIIDVLVQSTMNILDFNQNSKGNPIISQEKCQKLRDEFVVENSHMEKFHWCEKVLLELQITSDCKILSFQAITDGLGNMLGSKQLTDKSMETAKKVGDNEDDKKNKDM